MTQKRLFLFLLALLPLVMVSCGDDDDDDLIGKWYRVSDFDGLARSDASSFSIGNKGYLVCGNMTLLPILGHRKPTFPERRVTVRWLSVSAERPISVVVTTEII